MSCTLCGNGAYAHPQESTSCGTITVVDDVDNGGGGEPTPEPPSVNGLAVLGLGAVGLAYLQFRG